MTKARKGVYAAVATPLDRSLRPDLARFVRYSKALLADGLHGLAPLGTTGEGNSLPSPFRMSVPGALARAGIGGDRVIYGTGACALEDCIGFTRAVIDAGHHNVLVLPPFYYKPVSDEGLYAFYSRLVEGVGDDRLRVYLYHIPQTSHVPISIPLIQRLKAAHGVMIAGLKDSSGDFEGSQRFMTAAQDFDVFPSDEGVLLKTLSIGGGGVISATTNVSARLARRTLDAPQADQVRLQGLLADVRRTIAKYNLVAAVKAVEARRAGDESWAATIPPTEPLSPAQADALIASLSAIEGADTDLLFHREA